MSQTDKPKNNTSDTKIRTLVVDDSAVIRAVISKSLSTCPEIDVVGVAINGYMAVQSVARLKPDIVILDIEMPIMDGLTAIPLILKEKQNVKIIICSTLSARGADVSIRALALGATECILKPGGETITTAQDFQKNLVSLVQTLGGKAYQPFGSLKRETEKHGYNLRKNNQILPPSIVAIGSSTGGPRALMDFLKHLSGIPVPIVITQHMPKTFTTILAQHIEQNCKIPCVEATEGLLVKPGRAYVAPGGFHMLFKGDQGRVTIHLDNGPLENFCKPAVDPMLRSLIPIFGSRILSVILTGMGSDGKEGCRKVVEAGGDVIAQDEESSVVWGMPGAVAMEGLCSAVLPIPSLAQAVRQAIEGKSMKREVGFV